MHHVHLHEAVQERLAYKVCAKSVRVGQVLNTPCCLCVRGLGQLEVCTSKLQKALQSC